MSSKNLLKLIFIILHFLQLDCNYSLHISVHVYSFYFILLFTFMFVFNYVLLMFTVPRTALCKTLFWKKCFINKNLLTYLHCSCDNPIGRVFAHWETMTHNPLYQLHHCFYKPTTRITCQLVNTWQPLSQEMVTCQLPCPTLTNHLLPVAFLHLLTVASSFY